MKAVIIEDEKPAARRLNRMLEKLDVEIISTLHSVEQSIAWFNEQVHPDIIFLDIQLNDGLSFEIFESLEIKSAIIFTTAYDEYALQAFKLNSIDYLLKPIDEEELQAAVSKYRSFFREREVGKPADHTRLNFEDIKKLLINPIERKYKKRFTVKIGQHLKMVPVEEIECFYSENKGTYIFTAEGRNYPLECSLENLAEELTPANFFRVNRKFYVNLNSIQDIVSYSNSRLKIKLNKYKEQEIIVAREKVKEFREWLE
ncbi:response regulator transcription factor [Antarcticibacterium flavum]|uniref:Response regulator transcription factor n=1 Tax=Antarcticibacterium flavum TaxID=2058175 RepID=A0A5B7X987_9FLAO|nr:MULTISPECIES: LytTR family DNA-binding domain-containing protein [Antarcticibacterium]MCM4160649.1 DNA-binding response regulator [Antarcticibacterium sp. W02-3]QCY71203.1 response regulator transcription factor [Antarcticibacterium flavum]